MNNRLILFFLITILLNFAVGNSQAQTKENLTIGIIYDGVAGEADELLNGLKNEFETLLGSKYNIRIFNNRILASDWSPESADANYNRLARDKSVDIIIGVGILTCSAIAQKDSYAKPVIMLGVFDPELQGLPPAADNKSGVHNLTYLLLNASLERDLDTFYEVFPYKKVGIVYYDEVMKFISADPGFVQGVMAKNGTSYELLLVNDNVDEVLAAASENVDAFYLGYLGPFEKDEKTRLIEAINARNTPTFGSNVSDVQRGILAAVAPEEDLARMVRRISLNIESILNGEDASNLGVHLSFEENLMLNMETANKIGFSPTFAVLAKSKVINEFMPAGTRTVNLTDVMHEAIGANLDLKIEESTIGSAQKNIALARTDFFPSITLGVSGLQVDKDRAEGSFGQQAQRSITGSATLKQLIFSEQVMSDLSIQKHGLRASEFAYEQLKLDVMLNAAISYFNVLSAKTSHKINTDNVDLTRRNLEISKQREAVGYSGRSDVYRWESRLATANTDLLASKNTVEVQKIQLNQLLNRSINEAFIVQESTLSDSLYISYLGSVQDYLNTPKSLNIYTDFLVEEAISNSPEIQQVMANRAALERLRTSFKLERFVPSVGLGAQAQNIFSRTGAGSNVAGVDVVDTPWDVSVNASLPLFQGGATSVNIQETGIRINKIDDQRTQLVQNVELNVRTAMLDLIVQAVNLESSKTSADFAERSLELVQDGYARGKVSIVDLVDAQNAALNANQLALDSEYGFLISVLKTERAIGKFTLLSKPGEQQDFLRRFEAYFNNRTQ